MSHKKLRPFIAKVSVLCYLPLTRVITQSGPIDMKTHEQAYIQYSGGYCAK